MSGTHDGRNVTHADIIWYTDYDYVHDCTLARYTLSVILVGCLYLVDWTQDWTVGLDSEKLALIFWHANFCFIPVLSS